MNTFTPRKSVIGVAIATMFLFTGCNSDSVSYNQDNQEQSSAVGGAKSGNHTAPNTKKQDTAKPSIKSKVSEAQRQEFLDAINAARAETQDCGTEGVFDPAPALTWNNRLDNAAYEHSNDMAVSDTFSHTGSGTSSDLTAVDKKLDRGSKFYERIRHYGYTNYRMVGENIAAGYDNTQDVIDAWLKSDHHCANLMNPTYKEVGMALVEKTGTNYGFYWSQEFGGK